MSTAAELKSGSTLTGIAFKVMSVAIFVAMSAFIKAAGELPTGQIVFFRSFFAIFPILIFLAYHGELRGAVKTRRPLNHFARGFVGVTAMGLSFFALTRLPLPEAITLNYAQPLMIVIFSAVFLRERVRSYRWTAVIVGLVGVVIISWPNLTLIASPAAMERDQLLGVFAALTAAAMSAVAMLLVRSLVHSEKTSTIVLWFSLSASLLSLLTIPFGWQALQTSQVMFLVAAGVLGGVAQILMTEAYRYAEASTVAPFEYSSMILGVAVGYLVFEELPTVYMLVGGMIVVGAGIFIILRERALGLANARARKASSPS